MLDGLRRRTPAGSTPSASGAPSTPTSAAPCSRPVGPPGSALRLHANQLGPGPGVQLAVELGCASADHCTHLTDADVDALAGSDDGRHVPAGHRLLDPPALPRRPPAARRRRHRRPGHQLQPGLELHDVDAVLHRPRRARDAHDRRRGGLGRHRRRRRRAAPRRHRPPRPGLPGRPRRARRPLAPPPRRTAPACPWCTRWSRVGWRTRTAGSGPGDAPDARPPATRARLSRRRSRLRPGSSGGSLTASSPPSCSTSRPGSASPSVLADGPRSGAEIAEAVGADAARSAPCAAWSGDRGRAGGGRRRAIRD